MLLPFGRDRRIVGRPARARLHCDAAPCGRVGTERHALLARAAWRKCELERREDALADRIRAVAGERARRTRAGDSVVGFGSVSGARVCARSMDGRA